ncbi:MAG TPA: hypothetical protein VG245_01640, partial [Candidatus Dormibacteraeota bacterium]|nr:hypothetical protein [Candidatus Dormibacteraeota bacterium]
MADTIDLNFVTTDVSGGTWLQWATPFTDVTDLVDKAIAAAGKKCIKRLVIAGHGADHTNGFFVFDPDTAGIEVIDGGTKTPMYGPVHDQLARLKPYLCPDAVIEFRVCRFGTGDNGDRALQSVADAVGVTVTAPTNSISSLGLIGGLATDWKKIQPGQGITTSFWRGETTPPPNLGASDIAAVNAGSVTTLNPAPPLPPVLPPIPPVAYVPLPNVPPPSLANLNAPVPSLTQADQQALS